MKTIKTLLCLICFLYASNVFSETMYVSTIRKITMRTGPSNDNKILEMLESGDSLTVLQSGKDWSLVQTAEGKEGWVLAHLITKDKPEILLVESLQKENLALRQEITTIRDLNKTLNTKNSEITTELNSTKNNFHETREQYEDLKSKSDNMFQLEEDHKLMTKELQEKTIQANTLDSEVKSKNIKLFLYGAGVLLVGLLFGLYMKRGKKRSTLYY